MRSPCAGRSTSASRRATATPRASHTSGSARSLDPFRRLQGRIRFGQLGHDLVDQRGLKWFQAATYMIFGSRVLPWTKHFRACRDLVRRSIEIANEIGDLTYAAYNSSRITLNLLAAGDPLAEVQPEAESRLEFAKKAQHGLVIAIITGTVGIHPG